MNTEALLSIEKGEKPLDKLVTNGGFCGIFRWQNGNFRSVR